MGRDRRNLMLLIAQAPLLGILAALIFPLGAFERLDYARNATNLIFLLTTIAVWLGAISASREVVRERALVFRETAVGVRISSYLASKVLVLWGLSAIQVSLMLGSVLLIQQPSFTLVEFGSLWACLTVAACTAVTLGLLISTFASTESQATSLIPIALIPQLLLGGAIVAVASMGTVMKVVAGLVFTRWFFAGGGSAVDLNGRIADDPVFSVSSEYGASFFAISEMAVLAMAMLFVTAFLGAAGVMIKLRDQHVVDMVRT